jgi:hypothetical protein
VRALDVGARGRDGELVSLRRAGEFYLLSTYAPGTLYADDLRRLSQEPVLLDQDLRRTAALARYLAELHKERVDHPGGYARAIRDLVGHGEGIFGIVDGYGPNVPAAPPERLQAIERSCLAWRWRLRGRVNRLRRTHGDFHPFNIVFQAGESFQLLDASRGCQGDPADDVAALAINYLFFALDHPASFTTAFQPLWTLFFERYLAASGDRELLEVIAPFLAWRGLVVANPTFYPGLKPEDRDRLLGFVERALDAERFDPALAARVFGEEPARIPDRARRPNEP